MAYRSELLYDILLTSFQDFDQGKIVENLVPAVWNLQPGDHLEYAAGQDISGTAEVVSVGAKEGEGVWCKFKKVS